MYAPTDGELRKVSKCVLLAEKGVDFEQSTLTALKSTGGTDGLHIVLEPNSEACM
jgi:hypothetical protein